MAFDLKTVVCKIKVENGKFQSPHDEDVATDLWKRYNLQSMLESCSLSQGDPAQKIQRDRQYLNVLTTLIQHSPDEWIRSFVDGFNEENICSLCVSSVRTVSRIVDIPPFDEKECYVFEESDFKDVAEKACLVQGVLQTLLKRICKCGEDSEATDTWKAKAQVGFYLLGIVAQHMKQNLWTSEQSITSSNESLKLLFEVFSCSTVGEIFLLDTSHTSSVDNDTYFSVLVKKSVIGKLLLLWKPFLQKKTWRQYPAIAASFRWCLCQLRFPSLSEFIELLLPPSLLFVDDHVVQNKEAGTECLIHILQNSTFEVLRWYGRADVIYEALKLQLYSTEDSLLKSTHEAMLLALKVIVKDKEGLGATTKYDEVFVIILKAAFHENKLSLRRVHTEFLHVFIEALGINVVKYITRLLELFEDYLDVSDAPNEEARLNSLKAMESLIKVAWPRIPAHLGQILKILVKLLHQTTSCHLSISETVEAQLFSYIIVCLELLKELDKERVLQCLKSLNTLKFSKKCVVLMQHLIEI